MIRYHARWVLPISRPPLEQATVVEDEGRIVYVGPRSGAPPGVDVNLGDVALLPGLVNAHTHLSLTALHGLVPTMAFEEWLPRIVTAMSAWTAEEFAASAVMGTEQSLLAGVTTVGDIVYGAKEADASSSRYTAGR